MDVKQRELKILTLENGAPFTKWFESIKDKRTQASINTRLYRAAIGNFGDHKFFRGVGELKIDLGPGYRVYFGIHNDIIIVLIGGGDKKTQDADIEEAVALWEKYRNEIDRFR